MSSLKSGNRLVITSSKILQPGEIMHLVIDVGVDNSLRELRIEAEGTGNTVGHVLSLYEDTTLSDHDDLEFGRNRNRNRNYRDDLGPHQHSSGGDDPMLFHLANFVVSDRGALLFEKNAALSGATNTGDWLLTNESVDSGRLYLLELTNTSPTPGHFTIEVNYSFIV